MEPAEPEHYHHQSTVINYSVVLEQRSSVCDQRWRHDQFQT